MTRLVRGVLVLWALLRGLARVALGRGGGAELERRRERGSDSRDAEVDPSSRRVGATRGAELALIALLVTAGLLFAAFAALIALDLNTQLLGLAIGGALASLAAALIVAGNHVVPQERAVEERPELVAPDEEAAFRAELEAGADGISRRGLIIAAAGVAGTGMAAAAALPVTALGPGPSVLDDSPWRASLALVDEEGKPVLERDIEVGAFLTAFPEGADPRQFAAAVMVVRVDPATLELPPERRDWAPGGLVAYSKICTHAACAVSLFRHPLYEPQSSAPALVCPCHYSTFDVRRAAKVVFGPAGRPLPQLPLRIDADGALVAAGPLSGSVGPAWFGTDRGNA